MRIHNCANPDLKLKPREYRQTVDHPKPHGLWWSVDSSWKEWCASDAPDWIKPHDYEVVLARDFRLLQICVSEDMLKFNREYGCKRYLCSYVDWPAVAAKYDGIEIPNYFWSLRLERNFFWYYGWDCASGVAWNGDKISLRKIEENV